MSVRLKDNPVAGKVIESGMDSIVFDHLTLIRTYAKNQINYLQRQPTPYTALNKDFNSYGGHPIQMLASPTAETVGKYNLNMSAHYVFLYKANYGVTERWDIGAGFTLIPNFTDSATNKPSGQLLFLSSKLKIRDKKHLDIAVGFNSFRAPRSFDNWEFKKGRMVHHVYVAANADYSLFNFSASLGQGYIGSYPGRQFTAFYTESDYKYIFTLSGSLLISDQIAIISENWWVNGIFNSPKQVNRTRRGIPDFPLIGGRYYTDVYGASFGIANVLIRGITLSPPGIKFYLDGFYYF